MKPNYKEKWFVEFNSDFYLGPEWEATHVEYDGAPDGNRHLYCHNSCLDDLLIEINEIEQKIKDSQL